MLKKISIALAIIVAAIIAVVGGTALYILVAEVGWVPFRSLPSDEEMLANFYRHRADFERLVQIYREDLSVSTDSLSLVPTPEVRRIMDRINVSNVSGDNLFWIPRNLQYAISRSNEMRLRAEVCDRIRRRFSGVFLNYNHGRVVRLRHLSHVRKVYYCTPSVPQERNGKLLMGSPAGYLERRLVLSLNQYPKNLDFWDSAFRPMALHWFIGLFQSGEGW